MARPKKILGNYQDGIKNLMDAAISDQNEQTAIEPETSNYGEDTGIEQEQNAEPEIPENIELQDNQNIEDDPIYSDEEIRAMKDGWTPKEVFMGDTSKWKDAKTWNENGRDNRKQAHYYNDVQQNEINQLKQTQIEILNMLKQERARVSQSQLLAVEHERDEAIRMGDVDKVKKLDDIFYSLRTNISNNKQPEQQQNKSNSDAPQNIPSEVINFTKRNEWFNGNDPLSQAKTTYAKALEAKINSEKNSKFSSLKDKYTYIEQQVSQQFDNPKRNIAPVENRRTPMSNNNSSNSLPDYKSIPSDVKRIVEYYVNKQEFNAKKNKKPFNKNLARENYVKELINISALDKNGNVIDKDRR
jgi:hypothetical protein